jgi:hypothetical protein
VPLFELSDPEEVGVQEEKKSFEKENVGDANSTLSSIIVKSSTAPTLNFGLSRVARLQASFQRVAGPGLRKKESEVSDVPARLASPQHPPAIHVVSLPQQEGPSMSLLKEPSHSSQQAPSPEWKSKVVLAPVTDLELREARSLSDAPEPGIDDVIAAAMDDMGDMCTQADRDKFTDEFFKKEDVPRKQAKSKKFMPKVRTIFGTMQERH